MKKATIFIFLTISFLSLKSRSQSIDSTWSNVPGNEFYIRYSPIDYLRVLEEDFKDKKRINVFVLSASPTNWVRKEHIDWLMKLIDKTDSTRSIMNSSSSYMSTDKYSSIGREAQNLIDCFRYKSNYPNFLNSFGPPDKLKVKELRDWWNTYKLMK